MEKLTIMCPVMMVLARSNRNASEVLFCSSLAALRYPVADADGNTVLRPTSKGDLKFFFAGKPMLLAAGH